MFRAIDSLLFVFIVAAVVICVPSICNYIAFCSVHQRRPGTDRPHYLSMFKYFANIADFYSDVTWTVTLFSESSEYALYAALFTFVPYILSLSVGISFVAKLRMDRSKILLYGYAEKYGSFVLLCSSLSGFYGTAELVSSHLFHLGAFSLPLDAKQRENIRVMRILNVVLLENLPLLIVQILYLFSGSNEEVSSHSLNITIITIMFSSISIISGISTILAVGCSKLCSLCRNGNEMEMVTRSMVLTFALKETEPGNVKAYHVHTHYLLQRSVAFALHLELYQVEVRNVQKISDGISATVEVKFLSDKDVEELLVKLAISGGEHLCNMKRECVNHLQLNEEFVVLEMQNIPGAQGDSGQHVQHVPHDSAKRERVADATEMTTAS